MYTFQAKNRKTNTQFPIQSAKLTNCIFHSSIDEHTWDNISNCDPRNTTINTLRPRQNGRRFADDTFKRIFLNENVWISIKISLQFVPRGPIDNISTLVQVMAWRRSGDKPLSEPMMVSLLTHICVTRPQCVKCFNYSTYIRFSSNCKYLQRKYVILHIAYCNNGRCGAVTPLWGSHIRRSLVGHGDFIMSIVEEIDRKESITHCIYEREP